MKFWCNIHQRLATEFNYVTGGWHCDRHLAGIMLPCQVVKMDGWTVEEDE